MNNSTKNQRVVDLLSNWKLHGTARPTNFSCQTGGGFSYLLTVAGVYWMLTDNGGEWMLERLNSGESARSIPMTWFGAPLNAGTQAGRIAAALRGEEIDYGSRVTDEDEAALLR